LNESERNLLSVDLGDVAHEALISLCKQTGRTKSECVRDAILISYHFGLAKDFNKLRQAAEELSQGKHTNRTRSKITPEEKQVIDTYREVYSYKGRIHNPAVLGALRNAAKSLDYGTIREMIELSGNHGLVASMLSRGEKPTIQMLLSEKMVGQLLPIVDEAKQKEVKRQHLHLEGNIKPLALAELQKSLSNDMFSLAFDMVQAAKTPKEVADIRSAAMNEQLDKYLTELQEAVKSA